MKRLWLGALAALALLLTACGGMGWDTPITDVIGADEASPSASAEATTEVECPGSWPVRQLPPGEANEWFAGGVPRLTEAKNNDEAQAILLEDWYGPGRADPEILAAMVYEALEEQVPTTDLVDGACLSERGVALAYQLEGAVKTGTTELGEVPAEGVYNTGARGPQGEVTQAEFPVITGDRSAVKVRLDNGHTFWVLVRCGNIGSIRSGFHPVGPTDQPPPPPPSGDGEHRPPTTSPPTTTTPPPPPPSGDGEHRPPTTSPPTTTTPPTAGKDPSLDPQVRGNTTPQETKTRPSADNQREVEERLEQPVDAGNGIPETSTPRQTPAPPPPPSTGPAPAPPSGPGPDQGEIPEPTEEPAPQPEIEGDPPAEEPIDAPPPP